MFKVPPATGKGSTETLFGDVVVHLSTREIRAQQAAAIRTLADDLKAWVEEIDERMDMLSIIDLCGIYGEMCLETGKTPVAFETFQKAVAKAFGSAQFVDIPSTELTKTRRRMRGYGLDTSLFTTKRPRIPYYLVRSIELSRAA